jgi:GST-like protein
MIHDGVLVPESTVMMEYIDGSFAGPKLRPDDPFERWRKRWWCRYGQSMRWNGPLDLGTGAADVVGHEGAVMDPALERPLTECDTLACG